MNRRKLLATGGGVVAAVGGIRAVEGHLRTLASDDLTAPVDRYADMNEAPLESGPAVGSDRLYNGELITSAEEERSRFSEPEYRPADDWGALDYSESFISVVSAVVSGEEKLVGENARVSDSTFHYDARIEGTPNEDGERHIASMMTLWKVIKGTYPTQSDIVIRDQSGTVVHR